MDSSAIIFITLGVNLLYQLIHYLIRKITNIYALRNEQENKNNLKYGAPSPVIPGVYGGGAPISSDESDKDAVTEIHV